MNRTETVGRARGDAPAHPPHAFWVEAELRDGRQFCGSAIPTDEQQVDALLAALVAFVDAGGGEPPE